MCGAWQEIKEGLQSTAGRELGKITVDVDVRERGTSCRLESELG